MRVLFLAPWFPYPADNGTRIRIFSLLRALAEHHSVSLISFVDGEPRQVPPELARLCRDVHQVPWKPYNPRSRRAAVGLLGLTPRSLVDTYVPEMVGRIRREVSTGNYDVAICSQMRTAAYWRRDFEVPCIFDELELGVFEAKKAIAPNPLSRIRHTLPILKQTAYLRRLLPRFAACTVVSDVEGALLRAAAPDYDRVEVVPNCLDMDQYASDGVAPQPNTVVFTGSLRYFANRDAMNWFLDEVFPLVRARVPDIRLAVTGDRGDEPLPNRDGVTYTGHVADVRPLIAGAWLSIAPIRLGGGTRLKIIEAMALGTPVVATSKGAEGLDLCHEEHLLVADTPDEFVDATARLLKDSNLRSRLSTNGRLQVEAKYDWKSVMPRFLSIVERAGSRRCAGCSS